MHSRVWEAPWEKGIGTVVKWKWKQNDLPILVEPQQPWRTQLKSSKFIKKRLLLTQSSHLGSREHPRDKDNQGEATWASSEALPLSQSLTTRLAFFFLPTSSLRVIHNCVSTYHSSLGTSHRPVSIKCPRTSAEWVTENQEKHWNQRSAMPT